MNSSLKGRALQALINIEILKQRHSSKVFSFQTVKWWLFSDDAWFQIEGRFSFERFQEILSATLIINEWVFRFN